MPTYTNPQRSSGGRKCRHCKGSGDEPAPLKIAFSRSGDSRGDLAELARVTGRSEPMISLTIAGKKTPGIMTLVLLAKALNVTVDQIIRIPAVWKRINRSREAE